MLETTQQQSMQAVLDYLGSPVRLEAEAAERSSDRAHSPAEVKADGSASELEALQRAHDAASPAAHGKRHLHEQSLGSPFQVVLVDDEESSKRLAAEESASRSEEVSGEVDSDTGQAERVSGAVDGDVGQAEKVSGAVDADVRHAIDLSGERDTEDSLASAAPVSSGVSAENESLLANDVSALDESELLPLDAQSGSSRASSMWDLSATMCDDGSSGHESDRQRATRSPEAAGDSLPAILGTALAISAPAMPRAAAECAEEERPEKEAAEEPSMGGDDETRVAQPPADSLAASLASEGSSHDDVQEGPASETADERSSHRAGRDGRPAPKAGQQPQRAAIALALQRLNLTSRPAPRDTSSSFAVFNDDAAAETLGSFSPQQSTSQRDADKKPKPLPLTPNRRGGARPMNALPLV